MEVCGRQRKQISCGVNITNNLHVNVIYQHTHIQRNTKKISIYDAFMNMVYANIDMQIYSKIDNRCPMFLKQLLHKTFTEHAKRPEIHFRLAKSIVLA